MAPCKDVNTKLLPMKVVMFGWFGASACVLPFMTVHMKELGLTVEETTIVYTLLPITQFLSSPIAGFIADRLGKYRNVLLLAILMTIVLATALLYVPPITRNTRQDNSSITILCDGRNTVARKCNNMSLTHNMDSILHLESCYFKCDGQSATSELWNMVVELKEKVNSSECDFRISNIHSSNSSSLITCGAKFRNTASSCIIICKEENETLIPSTDSTRNGRYLTFYLYSVLRILYNIFSAIGFTLVNSSAIALTEVDTEMGEYGRQRFWAMLAMAIFSPLVGILVDVISTDVGIINYAPAFHTHNILSFLTGIAVWYLDFELEEAPKSYKETFKNFWLLIRSPSIFFLLLVVFWLGTNWGFLESFLFWFLLDLGSPTYLLGLTVTIGSIVGLPFLHYARYIVLKLGNANLLSIAVFMYMIRCIGASFLLDPWWIMPFETLEIFTYHLMWVAAATYAAHLSPPGLLATVQGFIEGVHYGVGQGSGSLIGGSLMSVMGSRKAFQVMGGISGVVAIIYSTLHLFWLRKESAQPKSRRSSSIRSSTSNKNGRKSSTLSATEGCRSFPSPQQAPSIQETTQ